jgi:hypothetical protein
VTKAAVYQIQSLAGSLEGVQQALHSSHGDWQDVDNEAAQIHARLGVEAGRLRGELHRAEQSVAALEQASREVFQATRWTGGYGVRVQGSPGVDQLERARSALQAGDYDALVEMARAAAMAAQYAIQSAEREVARQRREHERRQEELRRERVRSMPNIGGGIPWPRSSGGGRSAGPTIRSSGGGGSRSSGSGFSRSGW